MRVSDVLASDAVEGRDVTDGRMVDLADRLAEGLVDLLLDGFGVDRRDIVSCFVCNKKSMVLVYNSKRRNLSNGFLSCRGFGTSREKFRRFGKEETTRFKLKLIIHFAKIIFLANFGVKKLKITISINN